MTALHIGCSGWAYRDWIGPFYPKGTRSKDLLADHDTALCISDHHHAPAPWETTASFVYARAPADAALLRERLEKSG